MPNNEVTLLIVEDDDGHAELIEMNLEKSRVTNKTIRFSDGDEVLDFLFGKEGQESQIESGKRYFMLLDIRMPRVSGIEVLKRIKQDERLKAMPVTMLTTTDDPREIEICHRLGCSNYVVKPVNFEKFMAALQQTGLFLSVVEIPVINGYSR